MLHTTLPHDMHQALLIGRLWVPNQGPVVVAVTAQDVLDLSALAPTCSELLDTPEAATRVREFISAGRAPRWPARTRAGRCSTRTRRRPAPGRSSPRYSPTVTTTLPLTLRDLLCTSDGTLP